MAWWWAAWICAWRAGPDRAQSVDTDFGTEKQRMVQRATPEQVRAMGLPAGSMGPKVEATCKFVQNTGGFAAIGKLADAKQILEGNTGTIITKDGSYQPNK